MITPLVKQTICLYSSKKANTEKYNKCKALISDTEKANPLPRQAHWLDLMSAQHPVFKNYIFIQYNVYEQTCIKEELGKRHSWETIH